MDFSDVSIISILVATLVGMVLGALWYSPMLFGNHWMKSIGKTQDDLGSQTVPMIGSIVASLMTAIGISLIFSMTGVDSLVEGVGLGLILGLLIVFPAFLSDNLFCGWGTQLLWIQVGYRVLSIVLMSIVMTALS